MGIRSLDQEERTCARARAHTHTHTHTHTHPIHNCPQTITDLLSDVCLQALSCSVMSKLFDTLDCRRKMSLWKRPRCGFLKILCVIMGDPFLC